MNGTQQPSQLRSVKDALRPITPVKEQSPSKRPRLIIAACPICQTKMSTLMLESHADRCKPRRFKPPKPVPEPPYLHLIFKAPSVTATFSQTPPEHSQTFTATINLRSFAPPTVLHLHATTPPPHSVPDLPPHSPAARLSVSILKSALQKCVRRNRPWPALRIAIVLMRRRATFELLRRLTIIILEDAVLHPAYPSLVFLLAATNKNHVLSYPELLHVLIVLYDIAAVKWSDPLPSTPDESNAPREHQVDLITALQVRAAYGGMPCDVQLLRRAAEAWEIRSGTANWRSRFDVYNYETSAKEVTVKRISPWLQTNDPVLRPGDIPLQAWDFHCCSIAEDIVNEIAKGKLKGKVPRFERLCRARDVAGVFKGLMWRFSSSVSHKKPLTGVSNVLREEGEKAEHTSAYQVTPQLVACAQTQEECVWKEELCAPVTQVTETYRKKYGL